MKNQSYRPSRVASFILAATSFALSASALACLPETGRGIAPENDVNIPVDSILSNGMTEEVFNQLIDQAEKAYSPVFTAQGRTLSIKRKWNDGTANAYAKRSGKTSEVHMYGGLARHRKITADGFQLVICHEIGHHIAGAPKISGLLGMNRWASNEGQSDYFATTKCARELWKKDDNAAIVAAMKVPPLVLERCQKAFDSTEEIALCQRSAMAGQALGDTLGSLGSTVTFTYFEAPDSKVVNKTNHSHPRAQCRLDTYFAGAVCAKSKDIAFSDSDPTVGACAQEKGETLGVRPLCWYKPQEGGGSSEEPRRPGSKWPQMGLSQK